MISIQLFFFALKAAERVERITFRSAEKDTKTVCGTIKRKWHSRLNLEIRDWLANGEMREGYRKSERRDDG